MLIVPCFIKTKKKNERIEQGYCLYISDNSCCNIYHCLSANKVLLDKNIIPNVVIILRHRTLTILFHKVEI